MENPMPHALRLSALSLAALLAACASPPGGAPIATVTRTTHGVAHIEAPDLETLAYGVAYAHAQDNVCQTAAHLVTLRGERSRHFGPKAVGAFGLRALPNEVIDLYVAARMDDAALAAAWAKASPDAQALARGYVAGYNRFLQDRGATLPAACAGQPWVQPMTLAEYRRMNELLVTQAGIAALADGVVGAQPTAWSARSRRRPRPPPRRSRRWPTPPRQCARPGCSIRPSAPTPGPSAARPRSTAAACCWATRTSPGPVSTASGSCTSPCRANST
jgi:acyl-homoserine lactone acylase PvdQ